MGISYLCPLKMDRQGRGLLSKKVLLNHEQLYRIFCPDIGKEFVYLLPNSGIGHEIHLDNKNRFSIRTVVEVFFNDNPDKLWLVAVDDQLAIIRADR